MLVSIKCYIKYMYLYRINKVCIYKNITCYIEYIYIYL